MVSEDIINKIFQGIINKCSIRSRANKLSIIERREKLEGKLNSREVKDYEMLMELYEETKFYLDNPENQGGMRRVAERHMRLINERLYEYDKRIFSDYKVGTPKDMDIVFPNGKTIDDFKRDRFEDGKLVLEQAQLNQQRNMNFTDNELMGVDNYINEGHFYINGNIYDTRFWKELNNDEKQVWRDKLPSIKRGIDSAIEKSEGLTQDTLLFHGGFWDISLEPGDHFNWDGYTSFSYRENVARSFVMGKNERSDMDSWLVVGYAPTGMKGLAIEDRRFNSVPNENEYLTGRGQGGTVVEYDEEEHMVFVLLDE